MQTVVAVVTMVRDDAFFLRKWVAYYGDQFGRENLYIVNHGRGADVARIAEGCNIIGIPGDAHKNFDAKRWRLLNGIVSGLRGYYRHVIVGDVDELIVLDPQAGKPLLRYLKQARDGKIMTPLGLEVIHRIDKEDAAITGPILGPRRHVRVAMHYSKPGIISQATKIARGGHFTQADELVTPENLYLFHLKFCDFGNYVETMNQRNAMTGETGAGVREAAIGRHWFAEARGEDRAVFEAFGNLKLVPGFDMAPFRRSMHASWRPRDETGYWQFDRPDDYGTQYELPERFFGVF